MKFNFKFALLLLLLAYLFIVIFHPISTDEAVFSIIGKNLDKGKLYDSLPDNKPPAIFVIIFIFSKIFGIFSKIFENSFFIGIRLVVFLVVLLSAYFSMRLSKLLFNPRKEFLLAIPFAYILLAVFFLGGVTPLTETFESLFLISSLLVFFECRESKYKDLKQLLLSSLLLFFAFQCKQMALFYLLIPFLLMVFEKKLRELCLFFGTFLVLFALMLLYLNASGILDNYIHYVWVVNFLKTTGNTAPLLSFTSLMSRIIVMSLVLPLILLVLPGISLAFNKYKPRSNMIILLPVLLVLAVSFLLAKTFTFRFYLLELVPVLLIFLPLSIQLLLEKKNSLFKVLFFLSIAFLSLFFLFVIIKLFGLFGGYTLFDNLNDVNTLDSIAKSHSCVTFLSGMSTYWYVHGSYSPETRYGLYWWNNGNFNKSFIQAALSEERACLIAYNIKPFYSLPPLYSPSYLNDALLPVAEEVCTCDYYVQKSSYSAVCYDCHLPSAQSN